MWRSMSVSVADVITLSIQNTALPTYGLLGPCWLLWSPAINCFLPINIFWDFVLVVLSWLEGLLRPWFPIVVDVDDATGVAATETYSRRLFDELVLLTVRCDCWLLIVAYYSRHSKWSPKWLMSVEFVLLCMFQTISLMGNYSWLSSGTEYWISRNGHRQRWRLQNALVPLIVHVIRLTITSSCGLYSSIRTFMIINIHWASHQLRSTPATFTTTAHLTCFSRHSPSAIDSPKRNHLLTVYYAPTSYRPIVNNVHS